MLGGDLERRISYLPKETPPGETRILGKCCRPCRPFNCLPFNFTPISFTKAGAKYILEKEISGMAELKQNDFNFLWAVFLKI